MYNIVKSTIEYREENNVSQKDLLQYIIGLMNMNKNKSENEQITIENCAGELSVFYIAGFDTTSSTIACCLYELARNKKLMNRLQEDIDRTLLKYDGEITYESINDIQLLELCFLGRETKSIDFQ